MMLSMRLDTRPKDEYEPQELTPEAWFEALAENKIQDANSWGLINPNK